LTDEITNSDDVIDFRDITARVEELTAERDGWVSGAPDGSETPDPEGWRSYNPDEADELDNLEGILAETKSYGGDHQWQGDWYPGVMIRESHFEDYARQLADDIGAIDSDAGWPNSFIDWEKAADALKMDYGTVDFDGVEYYYR
jgi:hypothetical protein